MSNPRDHGNEPSPDPVPGASPKVIRVNPDGAYRCPVCGCAVTCEIEVELLVPQFESGRGWGRYSGCPACEFASPMWLTDEKSSS